MLASLLALAACSTPSTVTVLPSTVRQPKAPAPPAWLMQPELPESYSESVDSDMQRWEKRLEGSQPR